MRRRQKHLTSDRLGDCSKMIHNCLIVLALFAISTYEFIQSTEFIEEHNKNFVQKNPFVDKIRFCRKIKSFPECFEYLISRKRDRFIKKDVLCFRFEKIDISGLFSSF